MMRHLNTSQQQALEEGAKHPSLNSQMQQMCSTKLYRQLQPSACLAQLKANLAHHCLCGLRQHFATSSMLTSPVDLLSRSSSGLGVSTACGPPSAAALPDGLTSKGSLCFASTSLTCSSCATSLTCVTAFLVAAWAFLAWACVLWVPGQAQRDP